MDTRVKKLRAKAGRLRHRDRDGARLRLPLLRMTDNNAKAIRSGFKFFAAISAVALVFIGVLLLLNLFFFEDCYMLTRREAARRPIKLRGS